MALILTTPSFGNSWEINPRIISRRTLDNELKTVIVPERPIIEQMRMVYENLSLAEKDALYASLVAHLGVEVELTDWELTEWIGIIIGNVSVIESNRLCGWSVAFEFEGIKQ